MLSVYEAIKISYSYHLRLDVNDEGTVKKMSVTLLGWLLIYMFRYRKSTSIIETYSIENIDFLAH